MPSCSVLPPSRVQTLEQVLSGQVATPRLYMILFALFSAVAVVLAALGIYGLIACIVSRRMNEMAIRVAIGARRGDILGMVIGEGIRLSVAGILLGLAARYWPLSPTRIPPGSAWVQMTPPHITASEA